MNTPGGNTISTAEHTITMLMALSRHVAAADAKDAQWVRPALVGEVTYSEETPDGRLRHPVWKGLRPDKSPEDLRI